MSRTRALRLMCDDGECRRQPGDLSRVTQNLVFDLKLTKNRRFFWMEYLNVLWESAVLKSSVNVQDYSFHSVSFFFRGHESIRILVPFYCCKSCIICNTRRGNHHEKATRVAQLISDTFVMLRQWVTNQTRLFLPFCLQDFKEQIIHHVATLALISFSWLVNYIRAGTLIMLVHDASDYLMEVWWRVPSLNDLFFFFWTFLYEFFSQVFHLLYSANACSIHSRYQMADYSKSSRGLESFYSTSVLRHFFLK